MNNLKRCGYTLLTSLLFILFDVAAQEHNAPSSHTSINTNATAEDTKHKATFNINIASQQLNDALIILSSQTQSSIAFKQGSPNIPLCPAIRGTMPIENALETLLKNSDYIYKKAGSSFIVKYQTKTQIAAPQTTIKKTPPMEEIFILGYPTGEASLNQHNGAYALTQNYIELFAIDSAEAIANKIPGIDVNTSTSSTLYIRGVGIDDNTDLSDPLVKYYENSMYLPRLNTFAGSWHDVESINIAPGPQNQLYSEASVGGHINVQHKKPDTQSSYSKLAFTTGSYNTQKINGVVNTSINQQNAFRVSLEGYKRDSYLSNITNSSTKIPGRADNKSLRLQYRINNIKRFNALFSHSRFHEDGTGNTSITLTPYLQGARTASFTPRIPDLYSANFDRVHFVNVDSTNRVRSKINQLSLSYSADIFSIQVNAAQHKGDAFNNTGKNRGLDLSEYGGQKTQTIDTLNQYDFFSDYKEQSARTAGIGFTLHLNKWSWNNYFSINNERLFWFWGDSDDMANGYIGGQYNTQYRSNSRSLYSELSYNPLPEHALTVGIRKQSNKKARNGIAILTENSDLPLLRHGTAGFAWDFSNYSIRNPNDFDDIDEVDSNGDPIKNLSAQDLQVITEREQWEAYRAGIKSWGKEDNVLSYYEQNGYQGNNFYISSQNGKIEDSAIDWNLSYTFDFKNTHDVKQQFYTALTTATSNSGFNDNLSSTTYPTYKAEKALAFTAGMAQKRTALSIKADLFWYKYQDKIAMINVAPSRAFNDVFISPTQSSNLETTNDFRINIPKARSYGASVDIDYAWNNKWGIRANALYLNAEYVKGEIQDSRMAAFSGFTNADPLRFNTPHTNITIPDSNKGTYTHSYNIYDYIAEPQYQQARPGADMNNDGNPSHYYQTACTTGLPNISGDGECYTVLNQAPGIEQPTRNLKGNKMPRSPSWDLYAEINYQKTMDIGNIEVSIGAKYRSDYYLTPYNGNGYEPESFSSKTGQEHRIIDEAPSFYDRVPSHVTFDAALRWHTNGTAPWQISLVGKNISNKRYFTNVTNTAWTYSVALNTPRTWECSLKKMLNF